MSFPFAARRFAFALVLVLVLVAAAPLAHAALFDDEEARKRIEATNQRLTQVQRAIEDRISALEVKVQSIVDLGNQMELLRGDFAKLRGNIEVLNYELEQAQKRQRDLYVDLDSRLRRLETAPPGAPAAAGGGAAEAPLAAPPSPPAGMPAPAAAAVPPAAAPVPAASDAAAEQRAYDAALDLFKRGDYNGAVNGFGAFVKAYPKSPLAPSAQYWVGNAQYARRDYKAAITAQRTLVSAYPDSAKVPDALLNIATAQSELGDNASARRTLEDLIAKYPKSESAQKARQRLGMR
jgi:tol-pal system protein YbgF